MATKTAYSAAYQDVNAVINGGVDTNSVTWSSSATQDATHKTWAVDGDTVVIPATTGTSWTSTLQIAPRTGETNAPAITLQGANVNATDDLTVIIDDVSPAGTTKGVLVIWTLPSGLTGSVKAYRMTGITFKDGTVDSGATPPYKNKIAQQNSITINGGSGENTTFRMDHCHFKNLWPLSTLSQFGWNYPCIDHNHYDARADGGSNNCANCTMPKYGGPDANSPTYTYTSDGKKDTHGSWADAPRFGTEKFLFFENNVVNNMTNDPVRTELDGSSGARFVIRYNKFYNSLLSWHGTDSGQAGAYHRGTRCVEIYENDWDLSTNPAVNGNGSHQRGGSMLWWNNRYISNPVLNTVMSAKNYRVFSCIPSVSGNVGQASGINLWDYNDTRTGSYSERGFTYTPVANAYADDLTGGASGGRGPGSTYLTGVATSTIPCANGQVSQTFTCTTSSNIALNQYAGFCVVNRGVNGVGTAIAGTPGSQTCATVSRTPYRWAAWIISNTATSSGSATITVLQNTSTINNSLGFNVNDTFSIHKVIKIMDGNGMGRGDNTTTFPQLGGLPLAKWPNQDIEGIFAWGNTLDGAPLTFPTTVNDVVADTGDAMLRPQTIFNRAPTTGDLIVDGPGGGWSAGGYGAYTPYTYPHPLAGGAPASTKIVQLIVPGMGNVIAFGNVVKGQTKALNFLIRNNGDSTLTVTSITYPTGYTGAFSGTILAGASQVVQVTFAPVLVQSYNGTITVNSDATSGVNTLPTTGAGVAASTSSGAGLGIRVLGRDT